MRNRDDPLARESCCELVRVTDTDNGVPHERFLLASRDMSTLVLMPMVETSMGVALSWWWRVAGWQIAALHEGIHPSAAARAYIGDDDVIPARFMKLFREGVVFRSGALHRCPLD